MKLFIAVLATLATATALPVDPLETETLDKRTTTRPTADDFYRVPTNIATYADGSIIRHRAPPAPIAALGIDPVSIDAAWQILYRTNDILGAATATVLTVLVPFGADLQKVLSYQVAEDAAAPDCAPSYALQLQAASGGGALGTLLTQAELLLVEAALYQGWVVVLPDHEGPAAAYLANRLSGQATLDGIRAALASTAITGIRPDAKVGLWGYSGGSLASMWAAALQPTYAPELAGTIVGAAVGGAVPNISNVVASINGGPEAGIVATGFMGLANQYPAMADVLAQHVKPAHQAAFAKVKTQCLVPNVVDFLLQDVAGMLDDPAVLASPAVLAVLDENALSTAPAPAVPMYVYKSVFDEISPIADTDALVQQYCAAGTRVEYVRDVASNHGALAVAGAPRALAWLIDRLDGTPPSAECHTDTTVSSLLDVSTLTVLPTILLDALAALLGDKIGPTFFG